jgi:hypothetical protein
MPLVDRLITAGGTDEIKLASIKSWLKIEHDLDDEILTTLRMVAVTEAFNFMQNDFEHIDDVTGELVLEPIPLNIVMCTYMFVAYLYENRGDEPTTMPLNCIRLLHAYKRLVGL